jgi:hypothetical protein
MKLIYVCSPYSGDVEKNVENARKYCRFVVDKGHIPFAPHLLFPQFMDEETERGKAMDMALQMLQDCQEIWAFGNTITDGMRTELNEAADHEITANFPEVF